MEQTIARVRLLSTAKATDREYDYLCPVSVAVSRGSVVCIPFGKGDRTRYGIVTDVVREAPAMALKEICSVLPQEVGLSEELFALCDHLRSHLFCTFGDAARAILPSPVYRKEAKKEAFLTLTADVVPEEALASFRGKNKEKYLSLLRHLSLTGSVRERTCKELFGLDSGGIALLVKKGLVAVEMEECLREALPEVSEKAATPSPLSPAQEKAYLSLKAQFDESLPSAALLYGVTGSGKTRVMLALCDYVLSLGKTVLYLVPEIALTRQSAHLLTARYGDRVAVLHSALSEGERRDAYVAIRRGEKKVVLGTRSAVFAPLDDLGLIVIDEEQDQSYKSDTMLKYHARDVARFRCAKSRAMLLLASATPDVESYQKAKEGKYRLVTLTDRYGTAELPRVQIVDLRRELREDPSRLLGSRLREELAHNLEAGEQSILLMNRRGYRRFVSCLDCGTVLRCPNCSVSLTLHNGKSKYLSCHYCGHATPLPESCPECGGAHLSPHGYGIQQLQEELKEVFPKARVIRMDSDTTTAKNGCDELISAFQEGQADILIGTQMVAKGHNFPNVTLVGVVSADSALYLSDYRAAEHAFSLFTQVIGRAGRAEKKGRALIQTLNPRHNVFSMAASQDYEAFFEGEIALRRAFQFPPFCQMAVFTLAGENEGDVSRAAVTFSHLMETALKSDFSDVKLIIYGPFEATVYRVKNIYRKRFIIKFKNNARTRTLFDTLLTRYGESGCTAGIGADIGPGLI
ncbi:MAG: primosomal protein N' [Clostridia bacterium]|nr:primosomal protein N' [Clostridia bacterium]